MQQSSRLGISSRLQLGPNAQQRGLVYPPLALPLQPLLLLRRLLGLLLDDLLHGRLVFRDELDVGALQAERMWQGTSSVKGHRGRDAADVWSAAE